MHDSILPAYPQGATLIVKFGNNNDFMTIGTLYHKDTIIKNIELLKTLYNENDYSWFVVPLIKPIF